LNSVSCPSVSQCVAVGAYVDSSGLWQGLLLTGSGTSWTAAEAPLPVDSLYGGGGTLSSVSCPAVGECVAVGDHDVSSSERSMLLTDSAGSWTAATAPLPANAASSDSVLSGVSCPSVSDCVAVGNYGPGTGQDAMILTDSAGSWTAAEGPLPANGISGGVYAVASVSCASVSNCVVIGSYLDTAGNGLLNPLLLTLSGGSWTAADAPLPDNAQGSQDGTTQAQGTGVSCPSASECVAVGSYGATSGSGGLLLVGPA
jgi:hypothetical protein